MYVPEHFVIVQFLLVQIQREPGWSGIAGLPSEHTFILTVYLSVWVSVCLSVDFFVFNKQKVTKS